MDRVSACTPWSNGQLLILPSEPFGEWTEPEFLNVTTTEWSNSFLAINAVVFSASVEHNVPITWPEPIEIGNSQLVVLKVREVWKGHVSEFVRYRYWENRCGGLKLDEGEVFLFGGHYSDDGVSVARGSIGKLDIELRNALGKPKGEWVHGDFQKAN